MKTIDAVARALASRGEPPMVFDWVKAVRLIVASGYQDASAGLSGDWEWTGGAIFEDGAPVPKDRTYTFLASNWATPEIEIGGVVESCYVMKDDSPGWDSGTYWPPEALAILSESRKTS
jgi:hypothetical protein